MLRSTAINILVILLTTLSASSETSAGEHRARTSQTFRITVPNQIRITESGLDAVGEAQSIQVSAGMDVVMMVGNAKFSDTQPATDYLVFNGHTTTISIRQIRNNIENTDSGSLLQVTILPGW